MGDVRVFSGQQLDRVAGFSYGPLWGKDVQYTYGIDSFDGNCDCSASGGHRCHGGDVARDGDYVRGPLYLNLYSHPHRIFVLIFVAQRYGLLTFVSSSVSSSYPRLQSSASFVSRRPHR